MRLNTRLLLGSLVVAAVASVGIGYLISRNDGTGDSVTLSSGADAQPPGIGTNAAVQGTPLPVVDLETLEGDVLSTADLLGRPLVLNIWYSTCAPCKKELPALAQVQAEYGNRVRFIGVNPSDSPEVNVSFARSRGVQYELLGDPDGAFTAAAGIVTAPVTLFVRPDGTIVRQTGELTAERLRDIIETELL